MQDRQDRNDVREPLKLPGHDVEDGGLSHIDLSSGTLERFREVGKHDPVLTSFEGLEGRVGLFGGSFDPVHNGHLGIAKASMARFGLKMIVFMPAKQNPLKKHSTIASDQDRFEMVRLAIQSEPGMYLSDWEIQGEGQSFTVDTVTHITNAASKSLELFFLMGADNIPILHKWKDLDGILKRATPITTIRDDFCTSKVDQCHENLSPEVRDLIKNHFVEIPPIPWSSTELRKDLAANPKLLAALPVETAAYLFKEGLYGTSKRTVI